jgi:hypothetical protein
LNGRLPSEAIKAPDNDMELDPTQATQPYFDPRRAGQSNSENEDLADIVCYLHPNSPTAYKIVEAIASYSPQHVYPNIGLSENLEGSYELPGVDIAMAPTTSHAGEEEDTQPLTQTQRVERGHRTTRDIALRFSSKVHDLCMGWVFGRNTQKCDVILHVPADPKPVSGIHFRIYVKDGDVLMLEDCSTNGTVVDHNLVMRNRTYRDSYPRIMIMQGNLVEVMLPNNNSIQFVVNIPVRSNQESKYQENLTAYLERVKKEEARLDGRLNNNAGLAIHRAVRQNPPPMMIKESVSSISRGF